MIIRLNGETAEVPPGTILDLLRRIGAPQEGVAVAVNGDVVPRRTHEDRFLVEGDLVEVIRAVGGG